MAVDPGVLFLPVLLLLLLPLPLPLPTMSILLRVEIVVLELILLETALLLLVLFWKLLAGSDSGASVWFPVEDIFSIYVFLTVFRSLEKLVRGSMFSCSTSENKTARKRDDEEVRIVECALVILIVRRNQFDFLLIKTLIEIRR